MGQSDSPLSSPTTAGTPAGALQRIGDQVIDATQTGATPTGATPWQIRCRHGVDDRAMRFGTLDEATEAACRLMDHGDEVIGIRIGSAETAMDMEAMALIYARWVRARYH